MRRPPTLALLAFVLALALRLLNAGTAFVSGVPRFAPVDELYHAKRMAISAMHFPRVLEFDPDRGTHGAWCPWPPLYDLAAGGYAHLLGAATFTDVLGRVIWLPPVLFALFAAGATYLAARARGALTGALAGFALATSPYLVNASSIGSIDHHYLEPLLAFAIALGVIRVLRGGNGILLGIAMIAAMFIQTALLLSCAVAFALLFMAPLLLRQGNDPSRVAPEGSHGSESFAAPGMTSASALGFAILTAAVALYAATRPHGYPSSAWFLGWPHAGIFAGATAALFLRARRAPALLALAAGVAVIMATPAAAGAILGGSHFLGGDPWLRTISEFLPVISEPPLELLSDVVLLSGGLILVWPLAARAWRTRDAAAGTVAIFAILYLLLDLSSRRFRPLAISFLALAGALEAGHLFAARRRLLAVVAILLVAVPPPIQLFLWLRQPSSPITEGELPWIRVAGFLQQQTPGGRILAPWSLGHLLDVIGQRPVVVDNFGSMPDPIDFARAHDALLMKDERALARYCDENAIRWIAFANPIFEIPEAAAVNDIDTGRYIESNSRREISRIHRLAQATVWWRAYFHAGAAQPSQGMFGAPLTRFRLVYTDPQQAWHGTPIYNGPAVQVWERVSFR